jgi:tetraacyldisaccharide 4'-kinase
MLLFPLSLMYRAAVMLRNRFYDRGTLMSYSFGIPVISVGNITAGGTGKTPHIEYLTGLLGKDFEVAVLSRGYKRQSKGFRYVEVDDSAGEAGDEPLQIKRKYPAAIVAVDADRVHGIRRLLADRPGIGAVLLDDAFQHRRVMPSLNVVLIDCNRPVWDDSMLPAGRLRDCLSSLRRADIIMITKCPPGMSHKEREKYAGKLKRYNRPVYFSHYEPANAYPLSAADKMSFDSSNFLAVSGIANPAVFFRQLEMQYPEAVMEKIIFPDHHAFSGKDIRTVMKKAGSRSIVTTEKDGTRLISYFRQTKEQIPESIFCIPVKVKIDDSSSFNTIIIDHVRKMNEKRLTPS